MDAWGSSRVAVFMHATAYMLGGTAVLAGAGYLLDQWLGTFPGFFIGGVVIAFPLVQLAIYKKVKSYSSQKVDNLKK